MAINNNEAVCAAPDCDEKFHPKTHNHIYHSTQCKRDVENAAKRRQLTFDVVEAVAPMYLGEDSVDKIDFLRKEILRLGRENAKLKNTKEEQVHAINSAIVNGLKDLNLEPVQPVTTFYNEADETAVVVISDLQLAKTTPTYNTKICEDRMEELADKVIKEVELRRLGRNINDLRIWMLGDIIEGMGIFPGQGFLIDSGFYRQVTVDGPRILGNFVRKMLAYFENVHIVAVIGNHGRMFGKDIYDPESNGDRMLYRILTYIFQDNPRVTFNIPDGPGERNWYAVDSIGAKSHLLLHGDQWSTFGSIAPIKQRVNGWRAGAIKEEFHSVFMGHFHQPTKLTFSDLTFRINGSTESTNTYAQERLASMGDPSQHLMFIDLENGDVTSEVDIFLT